eukprot:snap_masked-scaffold_8-processed-gene-3.60-mRNA-1 protein AED:1.00 eAED:1.00 QI:0/-1/0/0/-1/1/1/0/378
MPKKKGKKGKKGKVVAVNPQEVERIEFVSKAKKLKTDIELEVSLLQQTGIEREDLYALWLRLREENENVKLRIREKENKVADDKALGEVIVNNCKNELKEHLIRFLDSATQAKKETEEILISEEGKDLLEYHELEFLELELRKLVFEEEKNQQKILFGLKREHDDQVLGLRNQFEQNSKELYEQYCYRSKTVHQKIRNETSQLLERVKDDKLKQISTIKERHTKKLFDIKNYFSDIIHNNLDLIRNLKEELLELRKKDIKDEKHLSEVAGKNKTLSFPLKEALKNIESLKSEIKEYEHLKEQLRLTKQKIDKIKQDNEEKEWKFEVIFQKIAFLKKEEDLIKAKYEETIEAIKLENETRIVFIEEKLKTLEETENMTQ